MPGMSDEIITCEEAELELTLNKIIGYQVNAWFDVVVKSDTHTVDYDLNGNLWMNATDIDGNAAPEATKILTQVPRDPSGDIHVYFTDFHLARSTTPPRLAGEEGGSGVLGATPIGENDIFISPFLTLLPTDLHRTRLVAHEVGHVMLGSGHPDEQGGEAVLEGTRRIERLMYTSIRDKIETGNLFKNLLVKREWDKAEVWLIEHIDNVNY
jgi:hypothetical protein